MNCPACGRCPFKGGVCEDRVNRGRRYFLIGALALPVARRLEVLAPPAPAPVEAMFAVATALPSLRQVIYSVGMTDDGKFVWRDVTNEAPQPEWIKGGNFWLAG